MSRRSRWKLARLPGQAAGLVPGGTLGDTLESVPLDGDGADLYIAQAKYHEQFCADLPAEEAALMAITQRPITEGALGEPSGATPLWMSVPSWFVFGDQDRNIPVGSTSHHGRTGEGARRHRDRRRVPCGGKLASVRDRRSHPSRCGLRRSVNDVRSSRADAITRDIHEFIRTGS